MNLNLNYSEHIKYGRNKNKHYAHGCNILNNNIEKLFAREFACKLDFVGNGFGLDNITDKYAGKECNYRHKHAVAYEIEHIKECESCDSDMPKHTEA